MTISQAAWAFDEQLGKPVRIITGPPRAYRPVVYIREVDVDYTDEEEGAESITASVEGSDEDSNESTSEDDGAPDEISWHGRITSLDLSS